VRRALLALALLATPGCYATRAAIHHNDLFNTRRSIDEMIDDGTVDAKTRERLVLVKRIMRFAEAEGLNTKGAYRYFIQTKEPVVSYIVQAAHTDRLESRTWWFPFVGSVPYLGYFRKEDRDAKADELKAEGFDVDIGGAGAFSSLGWFDDPLFSSMLNRNETDLAHLLFHELTHRTYWAPATIRFNENLAEYVGTELTVRYLRAQGDEDAIRKYERKRRDKALFTEWLKSLRIELEKLYENKAGRTREALLAAKKELFGRYTRTPLKPAFQVSDYVGNEEWNTASVLAASLYAPDTEAFAKAHRCLEGQPVSAFIATLNETTDAVGDPFLALEAMCRLDTP